MAFPDLNICGSRIRFAHHVKGHFENTEKTFLVRSRHENTRKTRKSSDIRVIFLKPLTVSRDERAGRFYILKP